MQKIFRRARAGCAAVTLAAVGLVIIASPAGARPSKTAHLFPLAGNSRYLVYSKNHAPNGSRGYTGCSHGSPTLHVRAKSGHTRTLAVPHTSSGKHYSYDADPCYGLQLNGDFLTLEGISGGRDPMYWWDLKRHTHGKVVLPANDVSILVVGTVAGGWLFAHVNTTRTNYYTATTIYRQGTSGRVTTYARLARFSLFDIETSPHGLLVGNGGQALRYRPVGSSKARTLSSPARKYRSSDCRGLTSTYAACESVKQNDESGTQYGYQVSITPLSGGHTITSTRAFDASTTTISEDYITAAPHGIVGLVYRSKASSGLRDAGTELRSFGTDGTVHSAPGHGATSLVVAYGKIIVGHVGGRLTSQGTVTGKQHTLIGTH